MEEVKMIKPDILDITKIKNKKILAMGAHSDDLEFCAGGTLLQLSKQNQVEVVIVTDGNMGTHNCDQDHQELVRMRMEEARAAAKHMGAKEVRFWSYPDLELENRRKMLLKHVVKELLRMKPNIVVTFDPWGRYEAAVHPDHRALAWAATEGVMMATLPKWVKRQGLGNRFLSPKSQVWLMCPAVANVVVNISPIWEERLGLLKVFVSQFDNDFQWDKMSEWVTRTSNTAGTMVGLEHGEGFRILEYMGEWNQEAVDIKH